MTSILIIPAIIAFAATAYILFLSYKKQGKSNIFFTMVMVFLAHHACEVMGFMEFVRNGSHVIYQLKIYYIVSVWTLVFILLYALEISKKNVKHSMLYIFAAGFIVTALIAYKDFIITDSQSLGYIMTAVRGPLYSVFQVFCLASLSITVFALMTGYRQSKDHTTQIQCAYMLFAFTPLFLSILLVLSLMAMGFEINAIAIFPIATTLFLIITFKSESQHRLTDARRFMPFSPERKTSQEIMELFSSYARDEMSYRESVNEIEKLLVLHKYSKNDKNASVTAQSMGMPRSSLYSIFNRLSIDLKEKK